MFHRVFILVFSWLFYILLFVLVLFLEPFFAKLKPCCYGQLDQELVQALEQKVQQCSSPAPTNTADKQNFCVGSGVKVSFKCEE